MQLKEYQMKVMRTLPHLGSKQLDLIHMILGMNSEFNEVYQASDKINRSEELADIAWYLLNYANLQEINLDSFFNFIPDYFYYELKKKNYLEMLQVEISILTDYEKKKFAYNKGIENIVIELQVVKVAERLNDAFAYYKLNCFEAFYKNIAKLQARYPEKFTEEAANNRDLETEREILAK